MGLDEKIEKINRIVENINKVIKTLLNEEDEESSQSLNVSDTNLSKSVDKIIDLGKDLFHDKSKKSELEDENNEDGGVNVKLSHDEIEFEGDFDDGKISEMNSAGYYAYEVKKSNNGVLLKLSAKDNKNLKKVGKNLELWIEIPKSEGLDYKGDFNPTLIQWNTDTGEYEDLDTVTMRVLNHNYKKK